MLFTILITLLPAQIYSIIETTTSAEDGFRLNAIYYRTDYNVTVLPVSVKYLNVRDEWKFSENSFLSLPFYFFVNEIEQDAFDSHDYIVIPFLLMTIPVIYGNIKMEVPMNKQVGLRFGVNTDYFGTFKFNWKTQSEVVIGTYADLDKLNLGLYWSKVFTNRLEDRFPHYVGISAGYGW